MHYLICYAVSDGSLKPAMKETMSTISTSANICLFNFFFFFSESFVKLIIEPSNLEKEKEEAVKGMLKEDVHNYLKYNDHSGDKFHKAIEPFIVHLINLYKVRLVTVGVRSVIIILQCPTLQSLEHLWNDCLSGHLDKVAERYLVTDEMKQKLNLETICLKTTIEQDNYLNCKKALMELPSTCLGKFKQSVWEVQ